MNKTITLSGRQLACVLWALRNAQMEILEVPPNELDYGEHADGTPLTLDEIDTLCEELNS